MAGWSRYASRWGRRGSDLLGIYLNDHLAGSTGGLELLRRLTSAHPGTPEGAALGRLEAEVNADREALREIMRRLGAREARAKLAAAWVAEKAGRLKANGYLVRRSPLSDVVELEAMMLGVRGKAALWRVLLDLARDDPRLDAIELAALSERAERQAAELETLRVTHASTAFRRRA
jgi:hypothetical protein